MLLYDLEPIDNLDYLEAKDSLSVSFDFIFLGAIVFDSFKVQKRINTASFLSTTKTVKI